MPVNKNEGLNACLCLLRKNLNNLDEGIRSAQYINPRLNTEYLRVHPALVLSLSTPCLYPAPSK